jgi:hypothetical protein
MRSAIRGQTEPPVHDAEIERATYVGAQFVARIHGGSFRDGAGFYVCEIRLQHHSERSIRSRHWCWESQQREKKAAPHRVSESTQELVPSIRLVQEK